jgi:hypothetical protein
MMSSGGGARAVALALDDGPGKKSPVERARFLPGRTRLVASSGNGRIESWTIPVGQW